MPFPTSPSWGYRVTQGLHVPPATRCVPLLLVKLWSVFPKLFARPAHRRPRHLALHAAERASIGVLVAAAIFQLATRHRQRRAVVPLDDLLLPRHPLRGRLGRDRRAACVHIAVKLPIIRGALGADVDDTAQDRRAATSRAC